MAVASEAGELLAKFRWVSNGEADAVANTRENRASIEAEAADIAIALLLFCDRTGIDLPAAIHNKIEVNRQNYPAELSRGHAERPVRPEE